MTLPNCSAPNPYKALSTHSNSSTTVNGTKIRSSARITRSTNAAAVLHMRRAVQLGRAGVAKSRSA